jgi:hypothetical protein
MKPVAWCFAATGAAAVLAVVAARFPGVDLRWLGAACGAGLAIAGVRFGFLHRGSMRRIAVPAATSALVPRFFQERRHAPRHAVQLPVHLAIDGHDYDASLVSISSGGALLRLRGRPGQGPSVRVGQPVTIQDYPAGTIARVGPHGVYVDFAISFDYARPTRELEVASKSMSEARS